MGRMAAICTILALILCVSVFGILYARDTKDVMETAILTAKEACRQEDQAALAASAQEMKAQWESREGILSLYVRHDEIEKMSTYLVSLSAHAQSGSFAGAGAALEQMAFLADHIYRRELPGVNNIL